MRLSATLLLLACLPVGPAQAQHASADESRRASAVAGALMSPFCPGKTLDACPSPSAGQWRRDIHTWTREGVDSAEIVARLQARVPGFDLRGRISTRWDWALPVGVIALSSLVLLLVTRRLLAHGGALAPPPPSRPPRATQEATDELDARLDAELSRAES